MSCMILSCHGQNIKIKGVIVAHDPQLPNGDEPPPEQILLVRVLEVMKGELKSKYVFVAYDFHIPTKMPPIPIDLMGEKNILSFKLSKDTISPTTKFGDILYYENINLETGEKLSKTLRLHFFVDTKIIYEIGINTVLPFYSCKTGAYEVVDKKD